MSGDREVKRMAMQMSEEQNEDGGDDAGGELKFWSAPADPEAPTGMAEGGEGGGKLKCGMGMGMGMGMDSEKEKEKEEEEVGRGRSRLLRFMMMMMMMMRRRRRMMMRQLLGGLLLGQLLSFLITATGIASSRLASMGVHAPTTQSLCNYILLALVYGPLVLYHGKKLTGAWYHYMLLAIIDVEANYLAVKAYQYTTITSVLLLDRGSLLFVIFLAWLVFKTKCSLGQLGGVFTCIVGVGILLFSDFQLSNTEARKHMKMHMNLKGDLFVLTASFLYAISNILEEFLARNNDFLELAACLGAFGSIVSAIQLCVLELHEIRSISWDIYEVLPFLGYAVALFTFYCIVPIFLKMNGSTMLSLSLITSDMWATCTQNYVYHQKVPALYFVSFGVVAIGMIIHSFFTWRSMPQDDIVESD